MNDSLRTPHIHLGDPNFAIIKNEGGWEATLQEEKTN